MNFEILVILNTSHRIDELTLSDPDELNDGNQQLAFMIDFSNIYDKTKILHKLKSDKNWDQYLYKEQALIYGKLGKFEEMFETLEKFNKDQDVLEMYAVRFYKENQDSSVFSYLISALWKIHEERNGGLCESDLGSLPDSIGEVMGRYFHCVDLEHVLNLNTGLPDFINLSELGRFLIADINLREVKTKRTQMLDDFSSNLLIGTENLKNEETEGVKIKKGSKCLVCGVALSKRGKLTNYKNSVLHSDCIKCLNL